MTVCWWSAEETRALIQAWRALRRRRLQGLIDPWVPKSQRTRALRTRDLVTADWQAVATAVRDFRSANNLHPSELRTPTKCQKKVKKLRRQFGDQQLATPSWNGFVPVLYNNTAGGRGLHVLAHAAMEARGRDECGGGAAGGQARGGSAVAEEDAAAPEVEMDVPVGAATENASAGVAVEAEVEDGAAPNFLEAPIPKKRRTGASTSTGGGDAGAPSVKEELVREANAPRAPAAAVAVEMVAVLSEVVAAHSNDVAVVENLLKATSTMYTHTTAQRIEVQKQMVAVLAAALGGAAVQVPDAAHA